MESSDIDEQEPMDMSRVAAAPNPNAPPDIQALPTPYQPPSDLPPPPSAGGPLPPNWWIPQAPDTSIDRQRKLIRDVFQTTGPTKEAVEAIQRAFQLEGILGLSADTKAGVPITEAMAKWAPKIYWQSPSAIAHFQHEAALKSKAPFVPNTVNVGGQDLIQMSPNRYSFRPKMPAEGLKQSDVLHGTVAELNALSKAISTEEDPAREKQLRQQHDEALARLREMTGKVKGSAKSADGVRVRNKKTGKTFRYKGDPSHLADQTDYEIIP